MSQTYAIIFVCQHGKLEAKAALLAASLRKYLRFDCDIIAAIPEPAELWGRPEPRTLAFLDKLRIRTVAIKNEIDPTYPIGNKVSCLSVPTTADKLILIDSDMFLIRPWEIEPRFAIPFNARPESINSFTTNQSDWAAVYAACGAPPLRGMVRTTYSGELIRPYFNSAFVAVPTNCGFGPAWLDCCRKIDAIHGLPKKRPHLDQIALSPAIANLGLDYDCLDETHNHPINFKTMDDAHPPLFCHYHTAPTLAREPLAVKRLRELISDHPELAEILRPQPEWHDLFAPGSENLAQTPGLDLLITGIPRSGTSFLCNLLHRYENCVALNEPPQIIPHLAQNNIPWGLARFFRNIRKDVLLGREIENKLTNDKVTEDTAQDDTPQRYLPKVTGPDFILGMKATIPFLSRLRQLPQAMPHAKLIACIRNPFDTIASWKTTFPHLRDADIARRPIGYPTDPWLTALQRTHLEQIAAIESVATRRAAWWRYLAELIIETLPHLTLVRYDDLVTNPAQLLNQINAGSNPGQLKEPLFPSQPRRKIEALDAEDVQTIRALCSEPAEKLGVYRAEP